MLEALQITIASITMVFIVLVGLMIILIEFKYFFSDPAPVEKKEPKPVEAPSLENDDESKKVAMITALICANAEQKGKKYEVSSIKRIR